MSRKLTPWFPANVKPVRTGIYFVLFKASVGYVLKGYAYWNGGAWGWLAGTKDECCLPLNLDTSKALQEKVWRGLASPPKC